MKCKIIRLKDVELSEKHAQDCLEQALGFDLDAELFDAINGFEYQEHITALGITPKLEAFRAKENKLGIYGCFLSHYYLWKQCYKENVPYLILEHDGYMIRPLPEDILDTFEDVLTLDRHDPYSVIYEELLELDNKLSYQTYPYFNHQIKKWKTELNGTGNHLRGAYAYIIKPNAASRLVNWVKKHGFLPADHQIGSAVVEIRMVVPSLARLHPAYYGKINEMSLTQNLETLMYSPDSSLPEWTVNMLDR